MELLTYIFLTVALMQCSNARKNNTQNIMNSGYDLFDEVRAADGAVGGIGDVGYSVNQVLTSVNLSGPGSEALQGMWYLVQHQRVNATTLFKNGLWKDYESYFGSSSPNDAAYWMGLDTLHQLTSNGTWKLAVKMKYKTDGSFGNSVWKNFRVDGESNKYMMHLGDVESKDNIRGGEAARPPGHGWVGLLSKSTDTQGRWNGIKFTTTDSDNDNNEQNCATSWGGSGWWFDDCWHVCLNCGAPDGDLGLVDETIMAIQRV